MFAGIVEDKASISAVLVSELGARITVKTAIDLHSTALGDSICISGTCLTVVDKSEDTVSFDAVHETLRRTSLGFLKPGDHVNFERSLRVGDRIHGHLVSGHIDAVAELVVKEGEGNSSRLVFEGPPDLASYIAEKGSICLSGVSLTVGEVSATTFSVYIIPHTASVTTLGDLAVGEVVNVEVDMLARYVQNALMHSCDRVSS